MKTNWCIGREVAEILRQRGFDVWWCGLHGLVLKNGQQRWSFLCNWIKK